MANLNIRNFPDQYMKLAKHHAVEEGVTLRMYVIQAIEMRTQQYIPFNKGNAPVPKRAQRMVRVGGSPRTMDQWLRSTPKGK
jgi:hypothetical protein